MKHSGTFKNISSSIETAKYSPVHTVWWILSNATQSTIKAISKYVLDILEPSCHALLNTVSLVSSPRFRKNWLKNIPISFISGVSEAITALKNATLWGAIWWTGYLYKHWIQDNVKILTNWTTEWIPWIWKDISKAINFSFAIPALIPHTLNNLLKHIDKPLDDINKISPFGKKSEVRLRI